MEFYGKESKQFLSKKSIKESVINRSSKSFELNSLAELFLKAEKSNSEKDAKIYDTISDALGEAGIKLDEDDGITEMVEKFDELYDKQQIYKKLLIDLEFYGQNTAEILKQSN